MTFDPGGTPCLFEKLPLISVYQYSWHLSKKTEGCLYLMIDHNDKFAFVDLVFVNVLTCNYFFNHWKNKIYKI